MPFSRPDHDPPPTETSHPKPHATQPGHSHRRTPHQITQRRRPPRPGQTTPSAHALSRNRTGSPDAVPTSLNAKPRSQADTPSPLGNAMPTGQTSQPGHVQRRTRTLIHPAKDHIGSRRHAPAATQCPTPQTPPDPKRQTSPQTLPMTHHPNPPAASQPARRTGLEAIGLEPTTPCLQSRCSPS